MPRLPDRLGLHAFTFEGKGSIPGWGTKIPQAARHSMCIYIYICVCVCVCVCDTPLIKISLHLRKVDLYTSSQGSLRRQWVVVDTTG